MALVLVDIRASEGLDRILAHHGFRATRTGYENCEVKSISAGIVEDLVKNLLRRVFRSPEVVERTLEAVSRIQNAEQGQFEEERRRIEEELAGVKACGQQLLQGLKAGENAFVRGELDRLDRRRGELEADLVAASERIDLAEQTPQATEGLARELARLDNIWDNLFPAEQQQLVRTVVERATLHTDRFEITLRADGIQNVMDLLVGSPGDGPRPRATTDASGKTTVSFPIQMKRRAGRKEIVLPEDATHGHGSLLLALARAFRWKDLLESGRFATIKALAEAVGLERSYLARMLNLTLLSPKIIEAIVAGNEPDGLSVVKLRQGVAVRWDVQMVELPGQSQLSHQRTPGG